MRSIACKLALAILLPLSLLADERGEFDSSCAMFLTPVDPWVTIPNLIAQWKMNDNAANTTVVDSKGGFNGTAQRNTSILTTSGKINGALLFEGTSDYVSIPTLTNNINVNATYALWYYPTNTSIQTVMLGGSLYVMYLSGTSLYCHNGISAQISWTVSNTQNAWAHYVIVREVNNVTLYENGITKGPQTLSGGPQKPTFIGRSTASGGVGSYGKIDDVRVYNNALGSNDVWQLYNNGSGTERE